MITEDELKKYVSYDPTTGVFTRVFSRKKSFIGKEVRCLDSSGYVLVTINREAYLAHRLAWLYMFGTVPEFIDHIDRDKQNNAIGNLREISMKDNNRNIVIANKNNKCGYRGVMRVGQNAYSASIYFDRNRVLLGIFETPEMAHTVYLEAKARYHANAVVNSGAQCVCTS